MKNEMVHGIFIEFTFFSPRISQNIFQCFVCLVGCVCVGNLWQTTVWGFCSCFILNIVILSSACLGHIVNDFCLLVALAFHLNH